MFARVFVGLFFLFFPLPGMAQYPVKPIRLFVPIPPGGGPDIVAHLIAPKIAEALCQPVVVENRVGSNGNIAGDYVAKSPPDGYTLLLGMDSLVAINPHLYAKMPFDPLKDLVPVASLVSNGFFIAINTSVPAQTLAEFIEFAGCANPPLLYASGGNGSQHHLTMERLKTRAGIYMVHVPYKGGASAAIATVAGEVSATMSGTSSAPQIKTGRLRAEVNKVLSQPDVKERLRNAGGVEAWITTPEEFAVEIRAEYGRYGKLVKQVGAKVD